MVRPNARRPAGVADAVWTKRHGRDHGERGQDVQPLRRLVVQVTADDAPNDLHEDQRRQDQAPQTTAGVLFFHAEIGAPRAVRAASATSRLNTTWAKRPCIVSSAVPAPQRSSRTAPHPAEDALGDHGQQRRAPSQRSSRHPRTNHRPAARTITQQPTR